jgi:hypothetical protein
MQKGQIMLNWMLPVYSMTCTRSIAEEMLEMLHKPGAVGRGNEGEEKTPTTSYERD